MKTSSTTKAAAAPRAAFFAPLVVLVGALIGPGLTGCKGLAKGDPVERVVSADSERILWDALRLAIFNGQYPVGSGADPGSRTIRSGWKLDLAPFKGRGFRTRAIVSDEPVEADSEGVSSSAVAAGLESFDVSIRIEKETNESLSPLNLDRADWTAADDDLQAARSLMQTFRGLLGTDEFEMEDKETIFGIE